MNERSDISRVLRHWFDDGPSRMPDRVVDVVADRIVRQRQLPARRLHWRHFGMNPTIKIGAAIAAVLIIAVVGWNLLPGGSASIGGPQATESPAPTASPDPTAASNPTPAPSITLLPDGELVAGDYRLRFAGGSTTTAIVTVPDGWFGLASGAAGPTNANPEILIVSGAPSGFYPDPCRWKTGAAPLTVGPTVDDLVSAIVASPHMEAGEPTAITVDGHVGTQIEVRMPSDIDFEACDDGYWYPFATSGQVIRPQGPGNIWNMRVLDVSGERLVVMEEYFDATPAAARAESQAVIDTLRLDVP
jgi:hypothetical protein